MNEHKTFKKVIKARKRHADYVKRTREGIELPKSKKFKPKKLKK